MVDNSLISCYSLSHTIIRACIYWRGCSKVYICCEILLTSTLTIGKSWVWFEIDVHKSPLGIIKEKQFLVVKRITGYLFYLDKNTILRTQFGKPRYQDAILYRILTIIRRSYSKDLQITSFTKIKDPFVDVRLLKRSKQDALVLCGLQTR